MLGSSRFPPRVPLAPRRLARTALLALTIGLVGLWGCVPQLKDATFECEPTAANPCPDGFRCIPFGARHFCHRSWGGVCGNGEIEPGEECDGEQLDGDCEDYGRGSGAAHCTSTCVAACGICGNGILDPGEQCDGEQRLDLTCKSLGYYGGTLGACGADCRLDTSGCVGYCGDGVRNGPEECDGLDHSGRTCFSAGLGGGRLGCDAWCRRTFERCTVEGWLSVYEGTLGQVTGLWAANAEDLWLATGDGLVIRRGAVESQERLTSVGGLDTIWGHSPTDVSALSLREGLYHFDGTSWSLDPSIVGSRALAVGPDAAWIYGGLELYHWDGQSWTTDPLQLGVEVVAMCAVAGAPDDVYAATRSQELRHWDGQQWTSTPLDPQIGLVRHLWCGAANDLLASSDNVYHFDGVAWSRSAGVLAASGFWGSGGDDVYMLTPHAVLRREGSAWTSETVAEDVELVGLWGLPSGEVFAFGGSQSLGDGRVLRQMGGFWQVQDTGASVNLTDVWGRSSDDLYAVGASGTILHYDGASWQVMASPTSIDLYHVRGNAQGRVFVLGVGETIGENVLLELVAGSWVSVPLPAGLMQMYDLWVDESGAAWVAGGTGVSGPNCGALLRYDGAWETVRSFASTMMGCTVQYAVFGMEPDRLWVAGALGEVTVGDEGAWSAFSCLPEYTGSGALWGTAPTDLHLSNVRIVGTTCEPHPRADLVPSGLHGSASNRIFAEALRMDEGWGTEVLGALMYFDGTGWSPMDVAAPVGLYGVWSGGAGVTVAVGDAGLSVTQTRPLRAPGGGACDGFMDIYCQTTLHGSLVSQPAAVDAVSDCTGDRTTAGSEVFYRLRNPVNGSLRVTLTIHEGDADLRVLRANADGGCDLQRCAGRSATDATAVKQVQLPSVNTGDELYFMVDGLLGNAEARTAYSIAVDCRRD